MNRRVLFTAILMFLGGGYVLAGSFRSENPSGAELSSPSIEGHASGVVTNPAGARLEIAAPMDESVDAINGAGALAAIGLLDPDPSGAPPQMAVDNWQMME